MPAATLQAPAFGPDFLRFFKEIKKNNNKEWFTKNKQRYEENVKAPCLAFIMTAGPGLAKITPAVIADARPVGGSMFRIYRDTRFSKDKSPYKTQAGIHFSNRANNDETGHLPGFYLHLEPGDSSIWSGVWQPSPTNLRQIRDAIVDRPNEWKKVKSGWVKADFAEKLKRVPQGFDPDHPLAEDLKLKDFLIGQNLTDAQVAAPDLLDRFLKTCKQMSPFNGFLSRAIGAPW